MPSPTAAADLTQLRKIVVESLGESGSQLDDTFLDYVAGVLGDDPHLANGMLPFSKVRQY